MKEKQIEEMARFMCANYDGEKGSCGDGMECDHDCWAYREATHLYNAGYRKQSENTMELPCKLGDKVWCIYNYTKPKAFRITTLTISENHYAFVIEADKGVYKHYCDKDSVGKYVFFTKEEAENALAKMKGGAK
jgi:hypothetical protein